MRLVVINCVFLACTATALAADRPRRHLQQIKDAIYNKLFSCTEPDCQPEASPVQFYKIPGFNDVVIKAVPKGTFESAPVYEKIPPNSHIGIVGSYLGTSTLNETYNALLGVKNLLTSGILSGKAAILKEVGLLPSKVQVVRPIKPCAAPAISIPLEAVPFLVQPPKVPVFPTQYSYKQVHRDGSLTTYTSSLELGNGVRVTESGKTLPFIIDRVRKIPVRLPVPVLPEISKIVVSEVAHPVTYTYQQIHQDGRMTSYMGLPSTFHKPGPVVVKESGIPPSPVFLMDRIQKVAAIASNPRGPYINVAPTPVAMNAALVRTPMPLPGPTGYSYSQMNVNGGMTTHLASGLNAGVVVTDNGMPAASMNVPSLPEKNPFGYQNGNGAYLFSHGYADGKISYPARPMNTVERNLIPISVSPGVPLPPNSFSYKQVGDGKMTTYTASGMFEEYGGPAVVVHGIPHPIPPPHITDRIEKVAAGAKYNRPPSFAVPVPTDFVSFPPVHPVKIPGAPEINSFNYKQVNRDGSMTSYGSASMTTQQGKPPVPPPAKLAMPFPQGKVRVFDSSMYSGPFPMNPVNPNAVKPSTPVSGSYSYKLVNSGVGSHPPVGPVEEPIVDTFAPPPPVSMPVPTPIQGCIDEDSIPAVHINNPFTVTDPLAPVPLTYSYKQISHSNPNPFVVVNVEDPVRGVKEVNTMQENNQGLPPLAPLVPPAPVNVVKQSAPFVPAPIIPMAVPQAPIDASPPSSFSYKQVTNQVNQPLPPPQSSGPPNIMEHRPTAPSIPPPMINRRTPQIQKDTASSAFSYKQVTNQGVYEYSDEFPSGAKTNLSPSAMNPLGNPGNVYVEQPVPSPTTAMPMPESPMSTPTIVMPSPTVALPNPRMPVPASPMLISSRPIFNRQNSLANNPIVVPESTPGSSFSFKSSNPDGSTITLKDDGHNSIAVHLAEATKTEAVNVELTITSTTENYPPGTPVLQETTPAEEGPVSGHARPMRRRVVRKKKPAVHRGDIPDASE